MKRITVLMADDNQFVRWAFKEILQLESDLEIIGEAKNGRQAVAMAREFHPALVLMDISMPLLNGLEATRAIIKAIPVAKVLLLSTYDEPAYLEAAVNSGAKGYLVNNPPLPKWLTRFGKFTGGRPTLRQTAWFQRQPLAAVPFRRLWGFVRQSGS
jgi:DNA-binding NarL/FixJ family response regulator